MAALRQSYSFIDHIGFTAQVRVRVPDLAAGSALVTPLDNATNAILYGTNGPNTSHLSSGVWGINASFPNAEDKALFVFLDTFGNAHKYKIPCPKIALFKVDGETLDLTVGLVTALAAAFIANVLTPENTALAVLIGGHRIRVRQRNKIPAALNPSP